MNIFNLLNSSKLFEPIAFGIVLVALVILLYFLFVSRKNNKNNTPDKLETLYLKIKEDIKYSVAPKFVELSVGVTDLVELAIEVWRIEQRLTKSAPSLPENQRKGLDSSVNKLKRYIEKYDIEVVDYTNQKFNDGLNLDVLSVEKDQSVTVPTVKETIEPTILVKGQVVKKAKIILLSN